MTQSDTTKTFNLYNLHQSYLTLGEEVLGMNSKSNLDRRKWRKNPGTSRLLYTAVLLNSLDDFFNDLSHVYFENIIPRERTGEYIEKQLNVALDTEGMKGKYVDVPLRSTKSNPVGIIRYHSSTPLANNIDIRIYENAVEHPRLIPLLHAFIPDPAMPLEEKEMLKWVR